MSGKVTKNSVIRAIGSSVLGLGALVVGLPAAHAEDLHATSEPPQATPTPGDPAPMTLSSPPARIEDSEVGSGSTKKPRMFGAMFDLGVPDGTMLSFVLRPVSIARFHAGVGYNGISPGLRIGAALLPFGWGPSLGLDYGHYFEGDANGVAGLFAGPTAENNAMLERVGYDYVALRAGMEFGGDRFTFFVRGGVSWLRMTIHELDSLIDGDDPSAGGNTTITVNQDPVLTAFGPSLQLGFIVQL